MTELFNPRFIIFDRQYQVAIVNSERRISRVENAVDLQMALPKVVLEQANAIYSLDLKLWVKWRAPSPLNPHTSKILDVLIERADSMIPIATWKNPDPLAWHGAFVNEHTGFYCGYSPLEVDEWPSPALL